VPRLAAVRSAGVKKGAGLRRRPLQKSIVAAWCGLAVISMYAFPVAAQSARAKEVGTHIKCLCKGCDMSAGLCAHPGGAFSGPCDTAKSELKEIDEQLGQGKTEQQIIASFVQEYGTIAYMEPPKHGFGLVAWVMPIVYSVLGLALVVFVVRKWAARRPTSGPATAIAAPHGVSADAFERARARASRDTEDY
jgi:cytochrome c-type biogenesis protein CcmH/NrfF